MPQAADFHLKELLYESPSTRVLRALRQCDRRPVILKVLKEGDLAREHFERYQHEYELLKSLASPGIGQALDFVALPEGHALVLEDAGGESLARRLTRGALRLPEFLDIAIGACEALAEVHLADIIHKDISPGNLIVTAARTVQLIDFGLASRLPRLNPALRNPEALEGTLAYIAPEQTGRMHRSLDYRADLYGLGATLFELLAGRPPFPGADAAETVYSHLARRPTDLRELVPGLPPVVARLVARLLEKNAEDRYQSAWGIRADLLRCRDGLARGAPIENFALGAADVPQRFQLSEKMVGRQTEIERLVAAFEADRSQRHLVLVSGYSGIGKSTLVREFCRPLTGIGGSLVAGKFDQFQRNTPYSALVAAFSDFLHQALLLDDARRSALRDRVLSAVGEKGAVVAHVIPAIEELIGPQPPVPELAGNEAQHRFRVIFRRFVQALAAEDAPLVLFLDDLQWADTATLRLLESLAAGDDLHHLLIIGAYRDNEVDAAHPLRAMILRLIDEEAPLTEITLAPLSLEAITELIAASFHAAPEDALPLAALVQRKTLGNPFFVGQFLHTLYREELITYRLGDDQRRSGWTWDMARVEAMAITDNVVDLLVERLRRLPQATQAALREAACIGNAFSLDTLAIIHRSPREKLFDDLLPALRGELLRSAGDGSDGERFAFSHDRVQQAAYALMDGEARKALHLDIGRLLLESLAETDLEERIFEVVDQLNAGVDLMAAGQESLRLAGLNRRAAERAVRANAYQAALDYLDAAIVCLPPDAWSSCHGAALDLTRRRAEVAYLAGDYDRSMADIAVVREKAENVLDRAGICALLISEYTVLGRNAEAVEEAREALALLGISVPQGNLREALEAELAPIRAAIADRSIASLVDLPEMTDPVQRMAMKVLMPVHTAAYFAGQRELYGWFLAKMTHLSLAYGHVPESLKGYASLGGVLCGDFGEFAEGYEFARLAIRLTERFPDNGLKCRASLIMVSFVNHWMRHVREGEHYLQPGIDAGLEAGEHQFVSYLMMWGGTINQMFRGANLDRQMRQIDEALAFTRKVKNHLATDSIVGARAVVANLLGRTPAPDSFDTVDISEADFVAACRSHNSQSSLCFYHCVRAWALYLHGHYAAARESIEQAASTVHFIASYVTEADVRYLHSLIYIALDDTLPRPAIMDRVDSNQALLKRWTQHCPDNFRHKHALVEAERARLEQRVGDALSLYEVAIAQAAQGGFIHDEALANELACRFWMARGKLDFAAVHLRRAYRGYQAWGAQRKLDQLAEHYANVFAAGHQEGGRGRRSAPRRSTTHTNTQATSRAADSLDLDAIVGASHLIAGERDAEALKQKLMHVALANAGADRGFLILDVDGALTIEARAEEGGDFSALPSLPLDAAASSGELPVARSVVAFAARTEQAVVLADATADEQFGRDPAIMQHGARSLLCLPLIHAGKLSGLLYLENRLACGAFSPAHVRVLEILSSQMAIAIENARILSHLDERVRTRTAELEAANRLLQDEIAERIEVEAALKVAREEAEAATRAKSDFLARMSHEIRTPMNAVIGLGELLQRTELTPRQKDYVRKLGSSANTLLGIINDVLDFSKIEAGRMSVEIMPFSLDEVLDNLANVVVGPAEEKGLEVLIERGDAVPTTLLGDSLRLGQVLINLAGNAVKFTAQGEVLVAVHRLCDGPDGELLRFSVRDTGIGINPQQLENLFQPFHQADGTITRRFGGTGLGLAISRQLVEMMGGTLEVRSGEGQGTTFWFDLPCREAPALPVASAPSTPETPSISGRRVLVVDDNATSRTILEALLQRLDLVVEQVDSGETALEAIARENALGGRGYDLVLMDWRMPGLDGIETTRRIRRELHLTRVPAVLMVTAYGREEVVHEAEKAGIDGFLVKPVSEALLTETVLSLFGVPGHHSPGALAGGSGIGDPLAAIRGARVLLVEDNPINQQVAAELLQQAGLRVDIAADGASGVSKACTGVYDLVLMDVQMPDMDGYEATRRIRAYPGLGELPIVAMTAHALAGDREKSRAAGMFDHLTKPIDSKRLEAVLLQWIRPAGRGEDRRPPPPEKARESAARVYPAVAGFDPLQGRAQVGGNDGLYARLLGEFVQAYADAGAQLAILLEGGEVRRAGILAHSIKGTAGTLGAATVSAAAAALEQALIGEGAESGANPAPLLSTLADELRIFCDALRGVGAAPAAAAAVPSGTAGAPVAADLEKLLRLIDLGSSEALELIERLREGGDATLGEQLARIAGHVEDVEFEEARDLVCTMLVALNRGETA